MDAVMRLLRDPEAETKIVAVRSIRELLPLMGDPTYITEKLLMEHDKVGQNGKPAEKVPAVFDSLICDNSVLVRREAALRLVGLAAAVGRLHTQELVLPLIVLALHDSESEVLVGLLQALLEEGDKLDFPTLSISILPGMLDAAHDAAWRVRVMFTKLVPAFAKVLGAEDFAKKLLPSVLAWLGDSYFKVRDSMADHLAALVKLFGVDWAIERLVPPLEALKDVEKYHLREQLLTCVEDLSEAMPAATLAKCFLQDVLKLGTDKVANVRMTAARCLGLFLSVSDTKSQQQVQTALKSLTTDSDTDVRNVAKRVLDKGR
jgi:HEAT repeat protein